MKLRYFGLIVVLAVTAAVALSAQQGTVHEKLYISLEHTDNVAVVDLAPFKPIKRLEFIPLSFWYDAPLTSRDSDRRHDSWLVYGSPICSLAPQSSWISPA